MTDTVPPNIPVLKQTTRFHWTLSGRLRPVIRQYLEIFLVHWLSRLQAWLGAWMQHPSRAITNTERFHHESTNSLFDYTVFFHCYIIKLWWYLLNSIILNIPKCTLLLYDCVYASFLHFSLRAYCLLHIGIFQNSYLVFACSISKINLFIKECLHEQELAAIKKCMINLCILLLLLSTVLTISFCRRLSTWRHVNIVEIENENWNV